MAWTRRCKNGLTRLRVAARREFLRDPTVILFERGADGGAARTADMAGGR